MSEQAQVAIVGVDFEDSGDDAVLAALAWLSEDPQRILHAVHVIDPSDVKEKSAKPALMAEEEALERVPAALAGWVAYLAKQHHLPLDEARVHPHVRIGKAAETMLQVAIDYDTDLIVVGTNARRGIDRLLLGSVAETLVRTARCPVLVARPKNYEGAVKTVLPDPPYPAGQEPQPSAREARSSAMPRADLWRPVSGRPTGFRIV
jgi:nucleotide-binding universal stress UspA family protein